MNVLRWYVILISFLLLALFVIAIRIAKEKRVRALAGALAIAYIVPVIYLAVYL